MFDKNGLIAIDELRGILTFMIIVIILLLLFFGCQVTKSKTTYEQLKFSKDEVLVIKQLNRFLETPVNMENKTYDLLVGYMKDAYKGRIDPEIVVYRRMDQTLASSNLPRYRRFMILLPEGGMLYDSLGRYTPHETDYAGMTIPEGTALLPVLPVSYRLGQFELIDIILQ